LQPWKTRPLPLLMVTILSSPNQQIDNAIAIYE